MSEEYIEVVEEAEIVGENVPPLQMVATFLTGRAGVYQPDVNFVGVYINQAEIERLVEEKIAQKFGNLIAKIEEMNKMIPIKKDPLALEKILAFTKSIFESEDEFLEWADKYDD